MIDRVTWIGQTHNQEYLVVLYQIVSLMVAMNKNNVGSTGQCWCVNTQTGQEILGTRKGPGQGDIDCGRVFLLSSNCWSTRPQKVRTCDVIMYLLSHH